MRLQKYLADAGVASRRKCEEIISEGRVSVNGVIAQIGATVDEGDTVLLDGKPVQPAAEKVVYAFYKPKNVICTCAKGEDRIKVIDYFDDVPYRLFTIGRLDYDSEGLIFVTNDGEFADKLQHPRYMKTKTYRVLCTGMISGRDERALMNGVMLDDGMTAPARINYTTTNQKGDTGLSITIHEGRNRQIRRMLEAVGHRTLRLKREGYGPLTLGELKSGEWRYLTDKEVDALLRSAKQ